MLDLRLLFRRRDKTDPDERARALVVAIYQRFWHDARSEPKYATAAVVLDRGGEGLAVIGIDGEFRGACEITTHATLEAARAQAIEWVGEVREVTAEQWKLAPSVWLRLRTIILTHDPWVDPPLT